MGIPLNELVEYLDGYLRTAEVPDSARAWNGLQVEGRRDVGRLAVAVDASEEGIRSAVRWGADLMVVHHGLFWDGGLPLTGRRYRKTAMLVESGIGLYSAHIPLDVHPEVGNNPVLARALGMEVEGWFGDYNGIPLGCRGRLRLRRDDLRARLEQVLGGGVRVVAGGTDEIEHVGVITGAAASMIGDAALAGLDAFVTGEGAHHTYFDAMELGVNVYYGGHYATEVWGVRALAEHLRGAFGLEWTFMDVPTGF
ncbi:MAG: Nif3-like dinuclear metal center hexameric protein [Gemmatimonadetes bacterium]|nr:Nif3-like dinuclear metal center hexameric protein [Gemmatimonadota bacterium]